MIIFNSNNIELGNEEISGKGRLFRSKFIEAGLVSYDKAGVLNVTKEALDRFYQTMVGCPVIIKHQDVTDENADELRVGVVSGVSYDETSGWYVCEGVIWDKKAQSLIGEGWSVSCTYDVTESTGVAGERNNIHFDDELVNGVFVHLALVPNPRYEKATITLFNSKEERTSMFKNIFNSMKIHNSDREEKDMTEESKKEEEEKLENADESEKEEKDVEQKSNESEEKDTESEKDEEKENADSDDEKSEDEDEKENSDDEEDEEKKENRCKNSKDSLTRLHNSYAPSELRSGYESERVRLARGAKLF
jgi:flagellar biosynthesis GTPase FlhF